MSATHYFERVASLLDRIHSTQVDKLREAGALMASVIASGGRVYLFGSGHSVIPVMDVFP
ncbi:MAG: SIS domain-containing protein, partial [Vicinamibacterales bacterium]